MLKAYKTYYRLLTPPTGHIVPPSPPPLSGAQVSRGMNSTKEMADVLGRIYSEHLEMFERTSPPPPPSQEYLANWDMLHATFDMEDYKWKDKEESRGLESPSLAKEYPPPTAPEVIDYINDIYSSLRTIAIYSSPRETAWSPHARWPGRCPYPILLERGFTQPRPGSFLRTSHPPRRITQFTSPDDFEAYIYSLSFHRDISPRTIHLLLSAILNPQNAQFLTYWSFEFALHSLILRKSDLSKARRVMGYMTRFPGFITVGIWNLFLEGALRIENMRSFALILRELLGGRFRPRTATWNLVLRMGLKLHSPNWVSMVLQVMQARGVLLDPDSLQVAFKVLKGVLGPERMQEEYERFFGGGSQVVWKVFNVVLSCWCERDGVERAWGVLLEVLEHVNEWANLESPDDTTKYSPFQGLSAKPPKGPHSPTAAETNTREEIPPQATLHLLLRQSLKQENYSLAWYLLGSFRSKWYIGPDPRAISDLFSYAYQKEHFSDMILIWEYTQYRRPRRGLPKQMVWQARELERMYGVPLLWRRKRWGIGSEVLLRWAERTRREREGDPLERVPAPLHEHVKFMQARNLSLKLAMNASQDNTTAANAHADDHNTTPGVPPSVPPSVPPEVVQWRQIEKTYADAVSSGKWKPRPGPLSVPQFNTNPYSLISGGRKKLRRLVRIEPPLRRVVGGHNSLVREMVTVWKMVQTGELKLEQQEGGDMSQQ